MFTFLLFMSGYVMQQQTVRSLQDALHAPPVPKPTPTLPPQFQKPALEEVIPVVEVAVAVPEEADGALNNVTGGTSAGDGLGSSVATESVQHAAEEDAIVLSEVSQSPPDSPSIEVESVSAAIPDQASTSVVLGSASPSQPLDVSESMLPLRLAYAFTVAQPSQICSALLFLRQHSQSRSNHGSDSPSTYLLLYPSRWETDPSHEAYTAALSLMRVAQDSLDIIYHPVRTTDAWSGLESASTQSQLLGELQRYRWAFDRMLYLKTPGLATDIAALDAALSSTLGSLRRNWVPLSQMSASSREANDPSIMLLSEKGILVPRGELRGRLTMSASTGSHINRHASEVDVEAATKTTAYIYFNDEELKHRMEEKGESGSVFERYERGINEVCKDSIFDREKGELRRR